MGKCKALTGSVVKGLNI